MFIDDVYFKFCFLRVCIFLSVTETHILIIYFSVSSPKHKKRSPTPKPTKVHVGKLTRNVTKEHIQEIFAVYGAIKHLEMPPDRAHPNFSKGFAYVDYATADEADKAVKHMDGGKSLEYSVYSYFNITNYV